MRSEIKPLVVTVRQAAELLQIGESTAWLWVRTGRLEATRIGRCTRIPMAAIEALIAAGKSAA